jgi:S1-C subfamily serine protease
MVRRSKQYGVPVIVAGDDVILGFDQPRLEQLAQRLTQRAQQPRFGLRARDIAGGGIEVGGTRPGSPAEQAGFQQGDILESIGGHTVQSVTMLERLLPRLPREVVLVARVRRNGLPTELMLTL